MIIEFSNATAPKSHSAMAMAIVVTACALFFIPTTLIVLGYYSSQPTGSLISPLPQTTLGQAAPSPVVSATPTPMVNNQPIIAAPNDSTQSANSEVIPESGSNIVDKVANINPGTTQTIVTDKDVTENSQIYLTPRPEDKSVYSVLSKKAGEFTISVNSPSDIVRYLDYHIVNP